MKKSLALLMVFLQSLSMSPCTEDLFETDDSHAQIEVAEDDCQDLPEADDCNSFCSCACCKIPVVKGSLEIEEILPYFVALNSQELTFHFNLVTREIWQPPKI